jgi:acyl-CoA synthetase (AMP-forming)/AMP-acid ligase II
MINLCTDLDYKLNDFSENPHQIATLVGILRYRAQYQPNQIALIFLQDGETESGTLTYQQLDQQARAIAALLQSTNEMGDRALLLYPSGLEFIVAFFGCLYAGVVAIPAYPPKRNQKMYRLEAIATDAQATTILTNSSLLAKIENQLNEHIQKSKCHLLTSDNIAISDLASRWQEPTINSHTLAYLQYTSGSTGTPKGAMISHRNVLHNSANIACTLEIIQNSILVSWLPHFHDFGLVFGIIQPIYTGCLGVLMSPESFIQRPIRWLQVISRYQGTHSGAPNFAYELCTQKSEQIFNDVDIDIDLRSWCVAVNGAEPIRQQTLEKFTQTFEPFGFRRRTFCPSYGLAEATLKVCSVRKTDSPVICTV